MIGQLRAELPLSPSPPLWSNLTVVFNNFLIHSHPIITRYAFTNPLHPIWTHVVVSTTVSTPHPSLEYLLHVLTVV